MFDDPTFDGISYMVVGDRLLEAARERPTLGLALARDRDAAAVTRAWFVGTRVTTPDAPGADVRFEGGAPPLSALARRMEAGEFGRWFEGVKAGVDSGRLQPARYLPGEQPRPPMALAVTAAPAVPLTPQPLAFEAVDAAPAIRARAGRR